MIATLRGAVSAIGLDNFVLDVSGVGYLVNTSPQTLTSIRHGQDIQVFTELIVREDSMTLFGFLTKMEVDLFKTVQSVSGIGPRIAVAVLAVLSPSQFAEAILHDDVKAITAVPGIGPKGAKRLALELKEKVAPFIDSASGAATVSALAVADAALPLSRASHDVVQGLQGLGWPEKAATDAVEAVLESLEETEPGSSLNVDSGVLLRLALRQLGGRQ